MSTCRPFGEALEEVDGYTNGAQLTTVSCHMPTSCSHSATNTKSNVNTILRDKIDAYELNFKRCFQSHIAPLQPAPGAAGGRRPQARRAPPPRRHTPRAPYPATPPTRGA